jgi:molybdate transport system substrate-binding protein
MQSRASIRSPKIRNVEKIVALAAVAILATATYASAADITFLCAGALQSPMQELIPEFQRASGHNVQVVYTNIGNVTERIRRGDEADLATVSPQQWESLQKDGKVSADLRVVIGKVGLGVFVKKGEEKPDVSSVDAFRRTLLHAHGIAVADPNGGSPEGIYLMPLFDRLGISNGIKSKLRVTAARHGATVEAVLKGDADIGFTQINEIIVSSEVDLVGPLPAGIQHFTVFTAAIPASAKNSAAAKAMIEFLTSPRALAVFKSKGLEGAET